MQDNILPQWTMDILLVVTGDHRGTLFISTNHSHLLFRRKQNVQDILLKRVEDISKQYLLILYIIVKVCSHFKLQLYDYKAAFTIIS